MPGMVNPMREITSSWLNLLKVADRFKEDEFNRDAREAVRFFDGPYDFMYKKDYATGNFFENPEIAYRIGENYAKNRI